MKSISVLVLQRLREHRLYAKFKNCEFLLPRVVFLSHIVSKDEIMVYPTKTEVVRDWKKPKSASENRSFIGMEGYYRHFVEGFSRITTPLTELTRKNLKFVWIDRCENNFQELKWQLITEPVLSLPSDKEKFVVYCDASREGLGGVLMQTGKMIAYGS
ncbi:uncharacterized mitochondrial protein AtMg00860-like [Humulus lupulus]|uniref:uncharacterized mitochondrial protein AtMg00860-like n=1 Tax=Humulus lupulus TaxID=3486 RepID=UPI002B4113A9|nr:uncharacterized mitochondrial protein AtMg00860-like [Humulus lupulus]